MQSYYIRTKHLTRYQKRTMTVLTAVLCDDGSWDTRHCRNTSRNIVSLARLIHVKRDLDTFRSNSIPCQGGRSMNVNNRSRLSSRAFKYTYIDKNDTEHGFLYLIFLDHALVVFYTSLEKSHEYCYLTPDMPSALLTRSPVKYPRSIPAPSVTNRTAIEVISVTNPSST